MRAEKVGADTMLARIVRLVAEAQRSRAPIQRLADRVSAWFVPLVVLIAAAAFAAWLVARSGAAAGARAGQRRRGADHRVSLRARSGDADVDHGGGRARALRPACSSATRRRSRCCARSTRWWSTRPARSRRASRGWSRCCRAAGWDEKQVLRLAASLERGSEHPLAAAIVAGARERGVELSSAARVRVASPARAWRARSRVSAVALGNLALFADLGIDPGELAERAEAMRAEGETVLFAAVDGRAGRAARGRRPDSRGRDRRRPRARAPRACAW